MEQITDPRNLDLQQIDYRIGGLKPYHHRILSYVIQGKNDSEIAALMSIRRGNVSMRIQSACDHVGVKNRYQLVAMYTMYSCRMNISNYTTILSTQYGIG